MSNDSIKIFVSGDFAPRYRVQSLIDDGKYDLLFSTEILSIINQSDFAVTNLECPLLETGSPIEKTGPNLKAPCKSIDALKYAGINMVTLANNHMMDYGPAGVVSTIRTCNDNGIEYVGVGLNNDEAKKVKYIDIKGVKIAFINCCENEWSTTHDDNPGCNPLDEISIYYQINEAKLNARYVLLIIHGGHEMYEYPSPRMKKLYRWFIDLGVNAVIGHHPHCCCGSEIYKGSPIFYSLGNFLFDNNNTNTSWNLGCAIQVQFDEEGTNYQLFPYRQCDENVGIHLLTGKEYAQWMDKERSKAETIDNDNKLNEVFDLFSHKVEKQYLQYLEPTTNKYIIKAVNKGLVHSHISKSKIRALLNIIRDEAHRDTLLRILNNNLYENSNTK